MNEPKSCSGAYYRAILLKVKPDFIPTKVRTLRDLRFAGELIPAGEYHCHCDEKGTVFLKTNKGEISLDPIVFEPLAWKTVKSITIEDFRPGKLAIGKSSGLAYRILYNDGKTAFAVREVVITNPDEWVIA
jgi:hypothetical protein